MRGATRLGAEPDGEQRHDDGEHSGACGKAALVQGEGQLPIEEGKGSVDHVQWTEMQRGRGSLSPEMRVSQRASTRCRQAPLTQFDTSLPQRDGQR